MLFIPRKVPLYLAEMQIPVICSAVFILLEDWVSPSETVSKL